MPQVIEATGILIMYMLAKLEKATNAETKLILPALKSFCEGRSQEKDFDQIILTSILRNARFPDSDYQHLKPAATG